MKHRFRIAINILGMICLMLFTCRPEVFAQESYYGEVVSQQFLGGRIYRDSTGTEYVECRMLITKDGILIPDKGSPLEGYILFPTQRVNLTARDVEDIFIFINYLDLLNRVRR